MKIDRNDIKELAKGGGFYLNVLAFKEIFFMVLLVILLAIFGISLKSLFDSLKEFTLF